MTQSELDFDGADYIPARDRKRLTGQIQAIYSLIKDGKYRTLSEISRTTGAPEASVSAQLRNLRKARFGAHEIGRRHITSGLYEYNMEITL